MSQYRISDISSILRMNDAINYDRYRYENKIEQISLSKKYLKRSDDASVTDEIARLKNETTKTTQWGENLKLATDWEKANGSRLDNIMSSIHRVRELAVEANNGSIDPESRKNIAKELDGLLETLIQDGNVTYVGTPMFSGKGLKPPHPEEWSKISTSPEPYSTYVDPDEPYKKFTIDSAMPAGGFKSLNSTEYTTWSATRTVWSGANSQQDYDPGWDTANNRPNPWNPGDEPKPGDVGMPPVGGHDWADLTAAEYTTWENTQTGIPGAYIPGFSGGSPNPWNPGSEPVLGEAGMPSGHDWADLTKPEFDAWLANTKGGYFYTKPPLSAPPTAAEKTAFEAANWDTATGKTKQWISFSADPEPIKPYPPNDPGMPSDHDWRYLTKDEYNAWKEENPTSVDPGWYEDNTVNPPINGHTKQWPSPTPPQPGQAPVPGTYDPNIGMPTKPEIEGGHTWDELTADEYMAWRDAQLADAGREDYFDPGWDSVNKHPNPWPRPQPTPVVGMSGMPSGHTWDELTEKEFDTWEKTNSEDNNYLGYSWDGKENLTEIQPGASGFKDVFFFDSGGKTFTEIHNDPDDPTKVTGVRYNGSDTQRTAQMAVKRTDVKYGMVGSGPGGLFVVPGESEDDPDKVNVFDAIIKLRDILESGNQPSEDDLKPIEDIADHVTGRVVESTVNQKKLESMGEITFNTQVSLENRRGNIEDLDVALAISQMTSLESAFQASMQMVSRVNSMQLMNYL